jgi:hypothetical protein
MGPSEVHPPLHRPDHQHARGPQALHEVFDAQTPARCTSALRGSRQAPCRACRRMAAISSSDEGRVEQHGREGSGLGAGPRGEHVSPNRNDLANGLKPESCYLRAV